MTTNPNSTILAPNVAALPCRACSGRGFDEPLSICLTCEGSGTLVGRYARLRELGFEVSNYHFALGVEIDFEIGGRPLTAVVHHPVDARSVYVEEGLNASALDGRKWAADILERGADGAWIGYYSRGLVENVEQAAGFLRLAQRLSNL